MVVAVIVGGNVVFDAGESVDSFIDVGIHVHFSDEGLLVTVPAAGVGRYEGCWVIALIFSVGVAVGVEIIEDGWFVLAIVGSCVECR